MKQTLIALVALCFIAGCGGQSAPDTPSDAAPAAKERAGASPATTDEAAAPAQKDGYTIAVIPKGLSHQFWATVKAGAEAAGAEFNAKILWNGPDKETEIARQIEIVEDMVSSGVDAIVMAACDQNALIGVLEEANKKDVTVVTIDSGVESNIPVSFVATDNIAGAKEAAHELARLIGDNGEVGLIPFVPGAATSDLREQGFREGIAEHANISLVATNYSYSDPAKGMSVLQDMLTANPNIKGVFAANEPGAIGAAQAVAAEDKVGVVKIVAFDASDQEIDALMKGSLQALIVQNPFKMGYEGVRAAVRSMKGEFVEGRIDTGVTVVTRENFNEPDIQKLLYPLSE